MGRMMVWYRANGVRLAVVCAAALAALAQSQMLFAAPDLELGRYLATQCLTCHRSATADGAIPNIFGMAAPRSTTLLKAYRDKQLPNPIMQSVAGSLKGEDIEALAAHFAVTKRP